MALGLALALGLAAAAQCALDARTYGSFGAGLVTYVVYNTGPQVGTYLYDLGLTELGARVYQWGLSLSGGMALDDVSRATADVRHSHPRSWYLTHLSEFLPAPLLPLLAIGAVVAVGLPSARLPLLMAVVYAVVTSRKGDKDFRLWLPLLPVFALTIGLGARALAGHARAALAGPRATLVATCLTLALGITLVQHAVYLRTDAARFGAYVDAAHWVERELAPTLILPAGAAPDAPRAPLALAACWNWAVLLQTGPGVRLTKLPKQLDLWRWSSVDDDMRASVRAALEEQDALIVHHSVLTGHLDLCEWLAERFIVVAGFWEPARTPGIGPILVLARRGRTTLAGHALVERSVLAEGDPRAAAAGLSFSRDDLEAEERVSLLAATLTRLAGGGVGWLETTWRADVGAIAGGAIGARTGGYQLRTRVADPSGGWAVDTWRPFGRAIAPSGSWPRGALVVDGWVVDPWRGSLEDTLEGAARHTAPEGATAAELWLDVATRDAGAVTGRLSADGPHQARPAAADGAVRVGTLRLPKAPGETSEVTLEP
ncbi:MAG: hypothetical protein R3F49_03655 [Planctomycetota bacterium]